MGRVAVKTYVFDSCSAFRLFVQDGPLPSAVETAIKDAIDKKARIIVPGLMLSEAVGIVRKKDRIRAEAPQKDRISMPSPEQLLEALTEIAKLPFDVVDDRPIMAKAVEFSRKTGVRPFDAMYVMLARHEKAPLFTVDGKLLEKVVVHAPDVMPPWTAADVRPPKGSGA